eukprot:TRINITY_DN5255_c0_g1_i10.p1 TRINITY_DN5255_c0_g1~~TRINITY_DN5255_c0_g1_i10.p1  ORF type:complete len:544 (-),score=29.22 TRINITY_DN5255_c0_g1_i10:119-1726(-)
MSKSNESTFIRFELKIDYLKFCFNCGEEFYDVPASLSHILTSKCFKHSDIRFEISQSDDCQPGKEVLESKLPFRRRKKAPDKTNCFTCEECQAQFASHDYLLMHKEFCHRNTYTCPLCNEIPAAQNINILMSHLRRRHRDVDTCFLCGKSVKDLIQHLRSHIGRRNYACTHKNCNQSFIHPENLRQHEKIHSGEAYQCAKCPAKLSKISTLKEHVKNAHDINQLCEENYHATSLLPQEKVVENESNQFYASNPITVDLSDELQIQNYDFNDESQSLCLMDIPQESLIVTSCAEENSSNHDSSSLDTAKHKVVKRSRNKFSCLICEFNARTSWPKLMQHIQEHKQVPQPCKECFVEFSTLEEQFRHTYLHHEECFQCETCRILLWNKTLYEKHVASHNTLKGLSCAYCSKAFRTKQQLDIHEKRHTGNGKFACQYCSKRFPQRGELKNHEEQHGTEKAYTCHECGKSFARESYLRIHMAAVHKEKPRKEVANPTSTMTPNDAFNQSMREGGGLVILMESTTESLPWSSTIILPPTN